MQPVSKSRMWGLGALYFVIGALGVLATDEAFRQAVGPVRIAFLGALVAGLVALRAFIDRSSGEGAKDTPQAVVVEQPSGKPIPVEEIP